MPSVGTAYVDIKINTKGFESDLAKILAKATAAAKDIEIKVDVDASKAEADLTKISAKVTAADKDVDIDVDVDADKANTRLKDLDKNVRKATSGINVLTGRLAAIADAFVILSPAVSAVGALAVPAITAIGQAIGGVVVGAGTAVIAFQGVGDAVKAMNAAALEPSVKNFEKVRQAMDNLSPEAQGFAARIVSLGDGFKEMRASAGEDLFPGLSAGMDAAANRVPEINGLLREYGGILGGIAQQSGEALGSDRWDILFSYLSETGGPTLNALSDAFGNVAHGVVELLDAFAPLSQGGLDWVADITEDFDKWAGSLKGSEGFAEFSEYVRSVGPDVAQTIGAITMALVDIGKAVAPLSGVVLNFLEAFAKAISLIADSPFGPTIMAGVIAWRAIARLGPAVSGAMTGMSRGLTSVSGGLTGASKKLSTFAGGMTVLGGSTGRLGRGLGAGSTALGGLGKALGSTSRAMTGFKSGVSKLGGARGMLGAAGLAGAATTGSKAMGVLMGVVSGAAIGSVFPGFGTAIGAVAGGLFGLGAAALKSGKQISDWDKLVNAGVTDFGEFSKVAGDARQAINKADETHKRLNDTMVAGSAAVGRASGAQGTYILNAGKASKADKETISNWNNMKTGYTQLGQAMGSVSMDRTVTDAGEMNRIFQQASPTLRKIGVDYKEWMAAIDSGSTGKIVTEMREFVAATDSAAAKNDTLAASFAGLDSDILTTADSAQQLAAAMEAVFRPAIDAMKGQIAFRDALRGVNEQVKNGRAGLMNHSAAADQNKTAMLGLVDASLAQAQSDAANNASGAKVAQGLINRRNRIREAGIQAGISGKDMDKFLNTTMDIPAQVKSMFSAPGIENAKKAAQALHQVYKKIPIKVLTHLRAIGADTSRKALQNLNAVYRKVPRQKITKILTDGTKQSSKEINALARRYKLTPKQIRTIVRADTKDANKKLNETKKKHSDTDKKTATPKVKADIKQFNTGIKSANTALTRINNKTVTPNIRVDAGNSMTTIRNVESGLNGLNDKSINVVTHYSHTGTKPKGSATGGWIRGAGSGTSDSIPTLLSNGEFVLPAAAARRIGDQTLQYMRQHGSLPMSARVAARMAIGGVVPPTSGGTLVRVAEAGRAERVTPLDRQGFTAAERQMLAMLESKLGSGGGDTYNVHPSRGMNEAQLADMVARRVAWNRRQGVGSR